ncbi:hypothetical protein [Kumtagia ephedrae]|uniref:hypothetical protein n=1 Tax=Kumtagia ephedrae TaxID=2116701 RepID=UPI0010575DA4|nr:hypothetical protein [Mesorhizobium ephedrae]
MTKELSREEAYAAMFAFIQQRWMRMPAVDEYAIMLGELSVVPDGSTADPASWSDWNAAVDLALAGDVDIRRKDADGRHL